MMFAVNLKVNCVNNIFRCLREESFKKFLALQSLFRPPMEVMEETAGLLK